MNDVRDRLLELPREALVDLLVEHGECDERLRERLLLLVSTSSVQVAGTITHDIVDLERAVRRAVEIEGYIDYRGAGMYARQVEEALDVIERVLASPQQDQALRLVEVVLQTLAASLSNVDESGELYEALERVKSLHLRACEVANLSPSLLAGKLFEIELKDAWYFLGDIRERYAHALGDSGRAEFERLLCEAWSALPSLAPNERAPAQDAHRGRLQGMMLRLVGGDLDAQIEVIKKDLSTASAFERIARLCVEGHQVERAITWAEKGLKIFPRRDAKLVQLVRDLYEQVGRHEELAQLAFDDFVEKLDVATYAALKSACSSDAWTGWRAKAVRHVEIQLAQSLKARTKNRWPKFADGTVLVEMLLFDGDLSGATAAAARWGCSRAATEKLSVVTEAGARPIGPPV